MDLRVNRAQKNIIFFCFFVVALYLLAYFVMLIFSARAYESYANFESERALKHAKVALWLAQKVFPENSETVNQLIFFSAKISTISVPYFLENGRTISKELFHLATNNRDLATSGALFLLSSEIANSSFNPDVSSAAAYRGLERLRKAGFNKDQVLLDKLNQERALGGLLSFMGVENNDEWEGAIERDFKDSLNRLCDTSVANCRYYSIRWELGKCIRGGLLRGDRCANEALSEAVDRKRLCLHLSNQECVDIYQKLRPYEFQLLSLSYEKENNE
jgi:hypothetical protein